MLSKSRFVISLVFVLWSGPSFMAEARVMFLDNPIRLPFSGFASSLALAGDVDGDGVTDYLVGAYNHRWDNNDRQGRVFVFSGAKGDLLLTIDHPLPQKEAAFGFSVDSAGDVNKDGTPDFLIGAFGQDGSGKAFVFNGKDGKLLYALQAPQRQVGAGFGWAVASLGDLTHDGIPEVGVGAFAQDGNGRVFIFNGSDGKLLRTIVPPAESFAFGWALSGIGDVNQDGVPDIAVGAPYTKVGQTAVQGQAYIFSGKDNTLLRTLDSPQPIAGGVFGWRLTGIGDLNKDGVPDLLIGAPYQDVNGVTAQGAAYAFSGADGKLLFPLKDPFPRPYAAFGYVVAESPDVNQDGIPEILVGAPYQTVDQFHVQGEVFLFNGRDGRHLTTFDDPYPHQGASFGCTVVSPGDIDGDKIPEFAIGACGQGIMDKVVVGRVVVFLSQP